jgi:hypothetical protein
MTSARKNWSEPDETGYCLTNDGMNLPIRTAAVMTTTILADRSNKLGISVL